MQRILLVSHVFPPLVAGGAPRMGQFARMLPDVGWEVTALTAKHGIAIDSAEVAAIASRARIVEAWSPITSLSLRGKTVPKQGWKGRTHRLARTILQAVVFPDREVGWFPQALVAGRRVLRDQRHDVVFASYGPGTNLLVGWRLAKEFRLPLVVDFRDLWSTLPMDVAFSTPIHRRLVRRLERAIVRDASRLVAVAPKMAEALATTHDLPASRAISITNGFDPADIERVYDARTAGQRPFRLMYAGSVHAHYDFTPLWQALRALKDCGTISSSTFRVEFIGNLGMEDPEHHGVADLVETRPFVARSMVFDELARADAFLVVETPGYYAEYGYAAKVFDYLLTGKPVVALVDLNGNTSRLLTHAGVGLVVEHRDARGVRHAVELALARRGESPRDVNVDAEPFRSFNRRHLVATLGGLLDDVVTSEPQGRWSKP